MKENLKVHPSKYNWNDEKVVNEGMDLRDYFANSAMQGIISNADSMRELTRSYERGNKTSSFQECVSDLAFSYANAMLKQREL